MSRLIFKAGTHIRVSDECSEHYGEDGIVMSYDIESMTYQIAVFEVYCHSIGEVEIVTFKHQDIFQPLGVGYAECN
jgi:tRNA A58 N-methylase Trm61